MPNPVRMYADHLHSFSKMCNGTKLVFKVMLLTQKFTTWWIEAIEHFWGAYEHAKLPISNLIQISAPQATPGPGPAAAVRVIMYRDGLKSFP